VSPLEERLHALAQRLRSGYDPQYATTFAGFLDAGEPVVGLEILSDQLLDDEVWVEPATVREIEELSRLMGMKPRYWEQLQSRVREPRPRCLELDGSFEADYDVEPLIDLPSALDYDFHEPGVTPRPDLLLDVITADGRSWTGGVRAGGPSAGSPTTGIYTTPNKNRLLVIAGGRPT